MKRRRNGFLLGLICSLTWVFGANSFGQIPPVVPGFPNTAQTPGAILSGLNAPQQGRTAIIAYHNGILFTLPELPSSAPGSDFLVRLWDISDPTNPAITQTLGISPMPINAHGYFKSGPYLVAGPNWPPEAPWSFLAGTPGQVTRTAFPDLDGAGVRGQLFQPWYAGPTYWSYGEVSGNATLELNSEELANWDHLGLTGVIGHPFILGDLLIYAADQSRTGVATYDISDPTSPVLLDVLKTGGPGGYWPELWGGDGKLYAVFPYRVGGNGFRIVDLTDPTDLKFVTDRPLAGDESMYIQFQDEFAFMGSHKVDMRTFESVLFLDGANTVRPSDGGTGINTSQFLLPLGNLLVTGGVGSNQGMAIWAHQAEPDTRGPSVGYHIPQAGRTNYPTGAPISLLIHETLETFTIVNGVSFIVRPLGGSPISGRLTFAFDDILTFTPDEPLIANTTYEVLLPEDGIKDAAGNGMVGYSFTFSTGSNVGGNAPPAINNFVTSAYPAIPGQNVNLSATATDPESGSLEYRFDFGDGSPKTAWSGSNSTGHTYNEQGHFQATVQVRDPVGAIATETTMVTVTNPPAGARATHSAPVICEDADRRVFTVNPDNNTVTAIDADTLAVLYETSVCQDPRSLAQASSGELWVVCYDDDLIHILNSSNGALVSTLDTGYGSAPVGIAVSPNGQTAYVALQGRGELRRYSTVSRQQTGSVWLGSTPRAVAVTGDESRILVTRFRSPQHHAEVWSVDAGTFNVHSTLQIDKFGDELNRDTTASGRGVANYLAGIAIAPDGQSAWVASNKPNSERGLFFAEDLDQDNTVRNLASELDLGSNSLGRAFDIDNSDSAVAASFSPLGDYVLIALQGNNEVIVLDQLVGQVSGLGSFVTRLATDLAPQGLCVDATTQRTFVKSFLSRTLTVLETQALFEQGSKSVSSSSLSTVANEILTPNVLRGKQIFYNASDPRMSSEGYMSCATCHADGGQDGRVWDFTGRGEGFRNTTSLRGRGGVEHGNVHWTANFDEIQDFENDIRNAFGGRGLMSDSDFQATSATLGPQKAGLSNDLDALAAYVASLGRESVPRSPFRNPDGTMTDAALRGRTVFNAQGCGNCHTGAGLNDSTLGNANLHDVGTLRTTSGQRLGQALAGIDTPTLLGLWNTAPYFHDGSAPTLGDVFRIAGGEVVQAETGSLSGAAGLTDRFVDLNNDDTVHGRAYIHLASTGGTLTLNNVDGGPGGLGAIELRYSRGYGTVDIEVIVNGGTPRALTLDQTYNNPGWRHTKWNIARIEDLNFNPGTSNTLVITSPDQFVSLSIDDILITTAADRSAAHPHRRVLDLPTVDQQDLEAFLLQLDGQPLDDLTLFEDDFETGSLSAWSRQFP